VRWVAITLAFLWTACGGGGGGPNILEDGRIEIINQLQPRPNPPWEDYGYVRAIYYDEELGGKIETLVPPGGQRKTLGEDERPGGILFKGGTEVTVRIVVEVSGTPAQDVKVFIDGNRTIIVTGVVPQSGVIYYKLQ